MFRMHAVSYINGSKNASPHSPEKTAESRPEMGGFLRMQKNQFTVGNGLDRSAKQSNPKGNLPRGEGGPPLAAVEEG